MTSGELIAELQKYPPESEVLVTDPLRPLRESPLFVIQDVFRAIRGNIVIAWAIDGRVEEHKDAQPANS